MGNKRDDSWLTGWNGKSSSSSYNKSSTSSKKSSSGSGRDDSWLTGWDYKKTKKGADDVKAASDEVDRLYAIYQEKSKTAKNGSTNWRAYEAAGSAYAKYQTALKNLQSTVSKNQGLYDNKEYKKANNYIKDMREYGENDAAVTGYGYNLFNSLTPQELSDYRAKHETKDATAADMFDLADKKAHADSQKSYTAARDYARQHEQSTHTDAAYYTEKIDYAIRKGDYIAAKNWMDKMVAAPLDDESRRAADQYIMAMKGRNPETRMDTGAYTAAGNVIDYYDRSPELFADKITSDEGAEWRKKIEEKYGIVYDEAAMRDPTAYVEAVREAYENDKNPERNDINYDAYYTFYSGADAYRYSNSMSDFVYRAQDQMDRAGQSEGTAAQMDSFVRSQTAYTLLGKLYDHLDVGGNSVVNIRDQTTQYLLNSLKEYGVDLTGMTEEDYRDRINAAMDEQSGKAQTMGRVLRGEGFDIDSVRQYTQYQWDQQYEQDRADSANEWAKNAPWYDKLTASVVTVPVSVGLGGMEALGSLAGIAANAAQSGSDPNEFVPMTGSSTNTELIRSSIGNNMSGAGKFFYDAGMSVLDNLGRAAAAGLLGGSFGLASEAATKLTEAISLSMMAVQVTGSSANQILQRGGNAQQALVGGLASGLIEVITEKVSLEMLLDTISLPDMWIRLPGGKMKLNWKAALPRLGLQSLAEGSEEGASDILNLLSDAIVMGGLSENNVKIRAMMEEGATLDEAMKGQLIDNIVSMAYSMGAGALSGFAMGGGGIVGNAITNRANEAMADRAENKAAAREFAEQATEDGSAEGLTQYAKDKGIRAGNASDTAAVAKIVPKVQKAMTNGFSSAETLQEAEAIYNDITEKYGDSAANLAKAAYREAVSDQMSSAKTTEALDDAYAKISGSKALSGESSDLAKIAAQEYRSRQMQIALTAKDADTAAAAFDAARNAGRNVYSHGNLDTSVTVRDDSGEEIKTDITGITGDGQLKLENGMTVSSDSVVMDEAMSDVYRISQELGGENGTALFAYYINAASKSQIDGHAFAMSFFEAFRQGQDGNFTEEQAVSYAKRKGSIAENYVRAAYRLGSENATEQTRTAREKLNASKVQPSEATEQTATGRIGKVDKSGIAGLEMTPAVKAQVEFAEALARLGVDVRLVDENNKVNGEYKDGVVTLNVRQAMNNSTSKAFLLKVMGHELTHFVQQFSPELYADLKSFVTSELTKQLGAAGYHDLVERKLSEYREAGENMDNESLRNTRYDQAVDEVVADSCEMLLKDSKVIADLYQQNATLFERVKAWIDDFLAKLHAIFIDEKASHREAEILMKNAAEQLQQLWDAALSDAAQTRAGTKNTATEGGDVRYSIAPSLKDDLQSVFDNQFESKSSEVLIGDTSDFLVNEIGAKPLPNYMPANKAYSAMVTEEKAISDGKPIGEKYHYHGLGVNGLFDLLEKAENPAAAYADEPSEQDGRFDRLVLVTDKEINGGLGVVVVEVDSTARHGKKQVEANKTITSYDKQSAIVAVQKAFDENRLLFVNKKSGTAFDSGRKGANSPTTISETVRKKNIQQFWENVNWAKYAKNSKSRVFTSGDTSSTAIADAFKKAGYEEKAGQFSISSDADYLSVAEKYRVGTATEAETEQLRQAVEQAARKAMPNTKILDEDGNLLTVYHGTSERFTEFDMSKGRTNMDINGSFFSPWELDAHGYGENVGKYYLNITNPANESTGYKALHRFQGQNKAGVKAREYLESLGYDGVNNEDEEFIAFRSEQIKSADLVTYDDNGEIIPLSERFNSENNDIRYSIATGDDSVSDAELIAQTDLSAVNGADARAAVEAIQDSMKLRKKREARIARLEAENEQLKKRLDLQMKWVQAEDRHSTKATNAEIARLQRENSRLSSKLDRQQSDIDTLRAENAVAKDRERLQRDWTRAEAAHELQKNNAEIAKLKRKIRESENRINNMITKNELRTVLAEARDKAAREMRQQKDEQFSRYKEGKKETEIRGRIKSLKNAIDGRLLHPSNKNYVPQELLRATTDLMDLIDTRYRPGNMSEKAADKLNTLKATYDSIKSNYPAAYSDTVAQMISEIAQTVEGKTIYELNADELSDVYTAMRAIYTTINNSIKADAVEKGKKQWEIGAEMINELLSGVQAKNRLPQKFANLMTDGTRMFERLGGYREDSAWSKVSRMLNDAQHQKAWITMQANRIFDPVLRDKGSTTTLLEAAQKLMSTKSSDLVTLGLVDSDGNKVKMTRDMMLALYMHLLNQDNATHLIYGITIPGIDAYYNGKEGAFNSSKGGRRFYIDSNAVIDELADISRQLRSADPDKAEALLDRRNELERKVLSQADVLREEIEGQLTDYERSFIECAKEFFEFSADRLNEASMELYGFKKAQVKNYFPIMTDSAYTKSDMESVVSDISIESWGSMKSRIKGARNPMYLNGFMDTISRHMDKMSTYAAMAVPMNTFKGIWQTQFSNYEMSMQDAFRHSVYGEEAYKWVENLYADLTGNRKGKGPQLLNKIRNNIAPSALMFNLSVMAKQAASYPTAIAEVGWAPAMKALVKGGKSGKLISRADVDLINAYTPLLWLRSQGMIDPEINDAKNGQSAFIKTAKKIHGVKQFYNFGVNGIQATDMATVGRLWSAAEYYVQQNFKDLERGTAEQIKAGESEYYQKVAEVFNRITERTQPDYTTMQRPDILRNPDSLVKSLTMFMTQRLQNFQIAYYALDKLQVIQQQYNADQSEQNKARLAEAKKSAANSISALVTSTIVIGVMTWLGGKWLLHKPWRDDDEDVTVASTLRGIFESCLESMAGNIVGGTELYNALKSAFTGEMYYGIEAQNISLFSDTVDAAVGTINWIKEKGSKASAAEWGKFFLHGKASKLINYVSQLYGIPTQQVRNLFTAAFQHTADAIGMAQGKYDRWWMTGANYDDAKLLADYIISGNGKAAEYRHSELVAASVKNGKTEDEAAEAAAGKLKNVVKDLLNNGDISEDKAIGILTGQYVGMEENDAFWTVDEWTETKKHDGDTEWKWSKYHVLHDAIDSGKLNLDDTYGYYESHGIDKDSVKTEIGKYISTIYSDGAIDRATAEAYLTKWVTSDSDDSYWKVEAWEEKAEHADDEDFKFSKYMRLRESIDSGVGVDDAVQELTEHGIEEETVRSEIKSYVLGKFEDGTMTESEARSKLSKYCKMTDKSDVDSAINNSKCFVATGVRFNNLSDAYRSGDISAAAARSALKKYGGKTEKEASARVRYWDFQKQYPDVELSEEKVNAYYDNGLTLPMSAYVTYCTKSKDVHGVDADGDGKTDSGSKKAAIMKVIDALPISDEQKDALYYLNGWAASTIYEAPWH